MRCNCWSLLTLPLLVRAWMPGPANEVVSNDGVNLFRRSDAVQDGPEKRWLAPQYNKIRGVNLGSLFIMENWMGNNIWANWGCNTTSEFDCVSSLVQKNPSTGQAQANSLFQNHWNTWYQPSDFDSMVKLGLNTIRIPVGYWVNDSMIASGEYFPRGGLPYLGQICSWAKARGLYVIIDLHGLPYAQTYDAFTGQLNPNPGFYSTDGYNRAITFLTGLTKLIRTNASGNFSSVGMIEIANEPERNSSGLPNAASNTVSMRKNFYPAAYNAIRNAEVGFDPNYALHIQMMDGLWNGDDPMQYMPKTAANVSFDDHNYQKYDNITPNTTARYLQFACADNRAGSLNEAPVIVGEWSISTPNNQWGDSSYTSFYTQYFSAQAQTYEKYTKGWVFWSWKTAPYGNYIDPRWDYQAAVQAGIIPTNLNTLSSNYTCS